MFTRIINIATHRFERTSPLHPYSDAKEKKVAGE